MAYGILKLMENRKKKYKKNSSRISIYSEICKNMTRLICTKQSNGIQRLATLKLTRCMLKRFTETMTGINVYNTIGNRNETLTLQQLSNGKLNKPYIEAFPKNNPLENI